MIRRLWRWLVDDDRDLLAAAVAEMAAEMRRLSDEEQAELAVLCPHFWWHANRVAGLVDTRREAP